MNHEKLETNENVILYFVFFESFAVVNCWYFIL